MKKSTTHSQFLRMKKNTQSHSIDWKPEYICIFIFFGETIPTVRFVNMKTIIYSPQRTTPIPQEPCHCKQGYH